MNNNNPDIFPDIIPDIQELPSTLEERVTRLEQYMGQVYLDTSILTGRIKVTKEGNCT